MTGEKGPYIFLTVAIQAQKEEKCPEGVSDSPPSSLKIV